MTEVGIPVYKAKDTLPKALDSLLAQTKEMFIVCLSIDGDGEDYSDIIKTYQNRGLKIRVINSKENGGPGMARQRILDTTQCEYLIYLDADDMLMPRAVEILTNGIRNNNLNILRSSFIREEKHKGDKIIPQDAQTITWFHGKIYRVSYLKENNIHFLPGLRTDEDAFFNVIAWNSTELRGEIKEITYLWRDNKQSITRSQDPIKYFCDTYKNYIRSQVEGLKELYRINKEISSYLVAQTLINIYYYYMRAIFLNQDPTEVTEMLKSLSEYEWMSKFLGNFDSWKYIVEHIKSGFILEDKIVFFREPFNFWAQRLLVKHEQN